MVNLGDANPTPPPDEPSAKPTPRLVAALIAGLAIGVVLAAAAWRLPLATPPVSPAESNATTADDHEASPPADALAWSRRPLRGPLRPVAPAEFPSDLEEAVRQAEPPSPEPAAPDIRFVGVSRRTSGEASAVLGFFRGPDGRVRVLGVGDTIAGLRVRVLEADRAILEGEGVRAELTLEPHPEPRSTAEPRGDSIPSAAHPSPLSGADRA
ncbi:MAG: hypothetical protein AAGE65_09985 [Planctomycetota bacterium]